MYLDFFGLEEKPFKNTPDPAFFFASTNHRQASTTVTRGIEDRCGLVLLVGDIGTGKTTICSHIQSIECCSAAYLNNPYLTEVEFLEKVNTELGIPVGDQSRKGLTDELRQYLEREAGSGRIVMLFVDEAHRLGLPVLDQILMLSNLQSADEHLLQIILAAQPEFLDTLRHPRLRSLSQRIGVRYHLQSMDRADTIAYVNHRLKKAGCGDHSLFSKRALEAIWKA
ncbi:MAG: AAA family ATPase, partial [Deltaproteobacteria bacterium]